MKKIIAFVLMILFVLPFAVSCGKDDGGQQGNDNNPGTQTDTDVFENVDFDGEKIILSLCNNHDSERNGISTAKYMTGVEDDGTINTQDTIVKAFRDRNDYVKSKLNIDVEYTYLSENGITDTYTTLMIRYNAHDGYADSVSNNAYALSRCMMEGILSNCNRDDIDNYFDLTGENWYKSIMDTYSFDSDLKTGKIFILASDYYIDVVRCIDVTYVNEDILSQLGDDAVYNFYEDFVDGKWTWDYMAQRAAWAFSDIGTTAGVADAQDKLGLIYTGNQGPYTAVLWPAFASIDIDVIENTGNGFKYTSNHAGISKAIDKISNAFRAKGTLGIYAQVASDSTNTLRTQFVKGTSLFCMGLKLFDLENTMLSSLKTCPLPYPKVNEEDEYRSYCHDNVCGGAIFKTGNFEACSAWIELSTEKSADPRKNYYEKGLSLKYETGTNTKRALDILYEGIGIPKIVRWDGSVAGANAGWLNILDNACKTGNNTFESTWASYGSAKAKGLQDYYDKFQALI